MSNDGDIVFMIGADVAGLTRAGQSGERALADMEKAAKTLEREIKKIGAAGVEFQREMNKLTGVSNEVAKSARESAAAFEAFDRSRQQVDNLRASIDPLFAASKRYEAALGTLDTALEQGAISARQHAAMVDQLGAAYLRGDQTTASLGGRMGFLGNVSDQTRGKIQQVGFQVQDFAVQVGAGTSATQAFAQQFPQLAGAFGPVGVAVGTLAAVLIPVAGYFLSASAAADEFAASLDRQKTIADDLRSAIEALRLEQDMQRSGAATEQEQKALNENLKLMAERNVLEIERTELVNAANDAMGAINQTALDAISARIAEIDAARALNDQLLKNLATERRRTEAGENARKIAEAYAALQRQIAGADISGPWQRVQGFIQGAIDKAREYAAASTIPISGSGRGAGPGGPLVGSADLAEIQAGGGYIRNMPEAMGGGGGGGGGGQTDLDALRQQFLTEEQVELESYARRQEALQAALEQKALTQQEYASLMEKAQQDHADKMTSIDVWRYGTGMDKAGAFFGDMASAMQGGNEEMLAISKKFGAAQALISAWQGAAEALKLPFPQNLAAFAKVLATGMGAVNAIKGAKPGGSTSGARGAGGAPAAAATAAPAQQNVQTLNFTLQNDTFGIGANLVRQIAAQLNEAQRNGSTLIRATVS